MTQPIDRVQRAGLVERTPDPDDLSVVPVSLTPHGRATLARTSNVLADAVRDHLSRHLTADQVGALRAGLGAVTAALGDPAEPQSTPSAGSVRREQGHPAAGS